MSPSGCGSPRRATRSPTISQRRSRRRARAHIDYVPGCAARRLRRHLDHYPLSSTSAAALLPEAALRATFERYWKSFTDRRDGRVKWDAFTPYEVRVIGAFVRLGWRDRANEALTFFMAHRRPAGWRQWAEVEYREPRAPSISAISRTWVGSDFALGCPARWRWRARTLATWSRCWTSIWWIGNSLSATA